MTRPVTQLVPILGTLAFLAMILAAVSGGAPGTALALGTKGQGAMTARIERYLNSITTLHARFLQVSPTGDLARGTILMSRPGKLRIDYDPPVPVLIVTEGKWLMLYDKELESSSYTSLKDSLAGFLVRPKIRFSGDVKVRTLHKANKVIRVTIAQRESPENGVLTLVFSEKPLILRQWAIIDGRGGATRVTLENPVFNQIIEAKAFEFTPPEREEDHE